MEKINYEKIQGKALINSVDIPERIAESNDEHERLDVQITFTYDEVAGRDKEVSDMLQDLDAELLALAEKAGRSNTFTYLLDATRLGYDAKKDDADKVVKELSNKMAGKHLVFTTYRVQVSELLKGTKYEKGIKNDEEFSFNAVHSDSRAYSSFNASYLLLNDDAENACLTMQSRIIRNLENDVYSIGRSDEDTKYLKAYIREHKED